MERDRSVTTAGFLSLGLVICICSVFNMWADLFVNVWERIMRIDTMIHIR